jgi:hypothetical protein
LLDALAGIGAGKVVRIGAAAANVQRYRNMQRNSSGDPLKGFGGPGPPVLLQCADWDFAYKEEP